MAALTLIVADLALHAAVLSKVDQRKSLELINYLIAIMPDSIDLPSARDHLTPLALAFLRGRTDAAKALIDARADQTTRDSNGKNLVHMALIHTSKSNPVNATKLKDLLSLIDKRLIRSLLTERSKDEPGGLTPLGFWLANPRSIRFIHSHRPPSDLPAEIFPILLDFGGEEALTMMDGSGQFPLHQAVKASHTAMVKLIVEHDPALLFRENAMGQTPLELAHSMYVRFCTRGNPNIRHSGFKALARRDPEDFVEKKKNGDGMEDEGGWPNENWTGAMTHTWTVCKRVAEKEARGRKLVSVNEAREVAKRLAERKKRDSEEKAERKEGEREEKGKKQVKEDEVDKWLDYGDLQL